MKKVDYYIFFNICKNERKHLLSKKQRNNIKQSQKYYKNDEERLREQKIRIENYLKKKKIEIDTAICLKKIKKE